MTDRSATILLDLDGTLLRNDMDVFLPAYFQAVRAWLSETVPGVDSMDAFLEASGVMVANDRPDRTLADAFYERFLDRTGRSFESMVSPIQRFYRDAYPALKSLIEPAPRASETVRKLHDSGHTLVVATNPLFPAPAILQRVDWAGLTLKSSDFNLVTSFERFHFAKPDPAYYAEILAYLGWPEGPIVMVGNEILNDIESPRLLGLATYLVDDEGGSDPGTSIQRRHGTGNLTDFPSWLEAHSAEELEPDFHSVEGSLAVLKSTAAALHSLVRETEPEAWDRRMDGEWTPLETLTHLKDVEVEVNQVRAESFLASDSPYIAGVDTDRWYADGFGPLPLPEAVLDEFLAGRMKTLEILAEIPRAAWEMPARHSILGPTNLAEIAGIMAGHDRTHLKHIVTLLETGTSGG